MLPFALNHMTTPRLGWKAFLELAAGLGCIGVEFRNDLDTPLFEDGSPEEAGARARALGLRIVGLSQVYPFNFWTDDIRAEVAALIDNAKRCGAETISLIPRNDGTGLGNGERQANLRLALREARPMLESAAMVALVEPLGFRRASLRSKAETVEAIEALDAAHVFKIVHDTFHHTLAGGGAYFADHTGIVHISGVVDPALGIDAMADGHRGLVDASDRLDTIRQIRNLLDLGYTGPISFEAFAPEVHALADPYTAIKGSIDFITSALTKEPA